MRIGDREIGGDAPVFIIAELSANHNGDKQVALDTIAAAAEAGADAIKLQTYTADTMTLNHDSADFKIAGGLWDGYTLYQLYQEAHTPWEWHAELFTAAQAHGLQCFSSPFDHSAVDFLEELGAPAHKLASFEITDTELIKKIALTGKPVIMSTGMSTVQEVETAVQCFRQHGTQDLAVLKCVSSYPAQAKDFHLRTIPDIAERFAVIAGLSDHSPGHTVAVTATALGAQVIEKHFILDRSLGGPDSSFSMEPAEFKALVTAVREAESSLGTVSYAAKADEQANLRFRRSIYVCKDIAAGEIIRPEHIKIIRPGFGLPPSAYQEVLGSIAKRDLSFGHALQYDDLLDDS